jgi:hypothetical protein
MEDNSVRLSFSGEFNPDLITMLLLMAKNNIGGRSVMKKIYNIMIECLENLTKHSLQSDDSQFPAIFLLGKNDDNYYLATGNRIELKAKDSLKKKLEKANSLEKAGLRKWYNEILMSDSGINERGGAGLGIIDMAMKSGHAFHFSFDDIDADFTFFTLKIQIDHQE